MSKKNRKKNTRDAKQVVAEAEAILKKEEQKNQKEFIKGYEKLCDEHKLQLVSGNLNIVRYDPKK